MLGSDPPQHSRLRRLVSRDFTPRRIRELEPRIREIAKELLDKVEAKGEFDVMADLANVLPVTVIAEMLGVPPELNAKFKHWSDTIIGGDNNVPGAPQPPETIRAIDELGRLLHRRDRKAPRQIRDPTWSARWSPRTTKAR